MVASLWQFIKQSFTKLMKVIVCRSFHIGVLFIQLEGKFRKLLPQLSVCQLVEKVVDNDASKR